MIKTEISPSIISALTGLASITLLISSRFFDKTQSFVQKFFNTDAKFWGFGISFIFFIVLWLVFLLSKPIGIESKTFLDKLQSLILFYCSIVVVYMMWIAYDLFTNKTSNQS
jgi:hypothetical protein